MSTIVTRRRVGGVALLLGVATALGAQVPAGSSDTSRKADTVALPTVKVAGRLVHVPPRFEAAYKRATSGRGSFFTAEEIEQTEARDLESLLARVPTVMINDRGLTFSRCQGGLPSPGMGTVATQAARVQVFIDNRRASFTDGDAVRQLLASIPVSSVQLMEVYTGVTRIPAEFVNDACAVIVIWTKSY